ncbi:hypothetical protein DYB28_003527 [Aphanomyces astaci]|uniref:Cytochrome b5 heme-binding domain-containing protein n=1 Tax=Aphanomyces astaci TaxID=112090 RepID=A0A397AYF1_APHAT|nr:hypothetical protein DYB36_001957 [Aphanomyces astaci]RHY14348.1 hypothetical protein DYB25_001216 [Aphanomyces astaci]RHY39074.1 hypothetical protein DYB30_007487 [Aphanomyces astaci]RHY53310.1 hypothetical protein DYB38_001749 [Aphanomyces astaci]RHY59010.1 hypothetical protein DYB34_001630 [Aphanomyces astaci]
MNCTSCCGAVTDLLKTAAFVALLMALPCMEASRVYVSSLEYQAVNDASGYRFSSAFLMMCLFLFGFLCTQPSKKKAAFSSSSLVSNEIFSYLDAQSLAVSAVVCSSWLELTGDSNSMLWQLIFRRDMLEDGRRFHAPCGLSWRAYYFTHRITRPLERMHLLASQGQADCIVVNSRVYDIGAFLYLHPGGHRVIADVIGTDATDTWFQFDHSDGAQEHMKELEVVDLFESPYRGTVAGIFTARQSAWTRMTRQMFGHAKDMSALLSRFRERIVS